MFLILLWDASSHFCLTFHIRRFVSTLTKANGRKITKSVHCTPAFCPPITEQEQSSKPAPSGLTQLWVWGKGCKMYILRIFQDEKAIKPSDHCFMTEDLPTPTFSVTTAPVFTFDPRQIIVHISRGFCQEFTLALKQTGSASSTIQRVSSKRNISRKTSQCNCYFAIFIATWYHKQGTMFWKLTFWGCSN